MGKKYRVSIHARQSLLTYDIILKPQSCTGRWRSCNSCAPFPKLYHAYTYENISFLQDLMFRLFIDKNYRKGEDFNELEEEKPTLWLLAGKCILVDLTKIQ